MEILLHCLPLTHSICAYSFNHKLSTPFHVYLWSRSFPWTPVHSTPDVILPHGCSKGTSNSTCLKLNSQSFSQFLPCVLRKDGHARNATVTVTSLPIALSPHGSFINTFYPFFPWSRHQIIWLSTTCSCTAPAHTVSSTDPNRHISSQLVSTSPPPLVLPSPQGSQPHGCFQVANLVD